MLTRSRGIRSSGPQTLGGRQSLGVFHIKQTLGREAQGGQEIARQEEERVEDVVVLVSRLRNHARESPVRFDDFRERQAGHHASDGEGELEGYLFALDDDYSPVELPDPLGRPIVVQQGTIDTDRYLLEQDLTGQCMRGKGYQLVPADRR